MWTALHRPELFKGAAVSINATLYFHEFISYLVHFLSNLLTGSVVLHRVSTVILGLVKSAGVSVSQAKEEVEQE